MLLAESLAQEFDPDKLPKPVVTAILAQMGAHSVTIWERNKDVLDPLGIVEGGRFKASIEVVRQSPNYFCRVFSQSFGIPPQRYRTRQRIERAKTLLAKRNPTVPAGG